MFKIQDSRVIVVGASRGLGKGVALALAESGANVLAIARDEIALRDLKLCNSSRIDIVAGDATDPEFVARTVSNEDPAGVFVVMGATPVMQPINEYRWDSFSDIWNSDVKATFHWLQELVNRPMRPGGRIVVFSSGATLHGSPLSGGYAPGKQAQRYLCDYMRGELAALKRDITIQCVLPKLTPLTELGHAAMTAYAARAGEDPSAYAKRQYGDEPLSAAVAGSEMVRLLVDETLLAKREFLLAGTGLKPLEK
ncbi:SDR family oxidoreductase [soil metagenome]